MTMCCMSVCPRANGRVSSASPAAHTKMLVPHNPELIGITICAKQPAINGTCQSSLPPMLEGWGCSFPDLSGVLQEFKYSFVSLFPGKTCLSVYTEESNRLATFGGLVRMSPVLSGQGKAFTQLIPSTCLVLLMERTLVASASGISFS